MNFVMKLRDRMQKKTFNLATPYPKHNTYNTRIHVFLWVRHKYEFLLYIEPQPTNNFFQISSLLQKYFYLKTADKENNNQLRFIKPKTSLSDELFFKNWF